VSKLKATAAAGPSWSVPARIKAQRECDDVFWINLENSSMPHWIETGVYNEVSDIGGRLSLDNVYKYFKHIDIVVFEEAYWIEYLRFSYQLRRAEIPYIIVPRCSFTKQALNNHAKWKKKIANILLFNKFFKGAAAIQYLTEHEQVDSYPFICPNGFVIPNGVTKIDNVERTYSKDEKIGLYIGRIDIYHKGLDLMLAAVNKYAKSLRAQHVRIDIYGPDNEDSETMRSYIRQYGIEDIVRMLGGISGEQKEKVLRNSDFFVMTSRFEGQPMAMLEALSYGLPCVAAKGTYMSEPIYSNQAGFACDNDIDEIGNAILNISKDNNLLSLQSANAYKLASKYNWSEQAKKMHDILEQIIK
jgi:glycosyltransferase involved in cell wall biosynthesis